jgi:hypothetical protein
MFREDSVSYDASDANNDAELNAHEIDRALRRLAQQTAALEADLARWLRVADAQNVWPQLGYVHALEYLEDVFGFAPRTAQERLRVARELGDLPELEAALADGDIPFAVARELTRVATPDTEGTWLEEARGRRLRDVERMVAGRKKGDGPEARPDPKRIKHGVWLELDGESMAAWRQMRIALEDELGEKLDARSIVLELARRMQHSAPSSNENVNANTQATSCKPSYMVHVGKCPDCRRAWRLGAGEAIEITPAALEHAECDAIIVDDENGERAAWSIPPSTKRLVMQRDHSQCQVPGCRSARFLDVHHIIHREHGGTNDSWNLLVLCSGHHRLHHDGLLEIRGRAPDDLEFARYGKRLVNRPVVSPQLAAPARNENVESAKLALQTLGFKPAIAKRAVEHVCAHGGATDDLANLIKESLRHC